MLEPAANHRFRPLFMDRILYLLACIGVGLLQAMPLRVVAQLGRWAGELVFWLDRRHRRMAFYNLTRCFGAERSVEEIRALTHENFRRIGENYCCAIKTAAMDEAAIKQVLEVRGAEQLEPPDANDPPKCQVLATGHFGNFELFGRMIAYVKGNRYRVACTYRGLQQPLLDQLLHSLRSVTGMLLFERRTGGDNLKKAMSNGGLLLVLVADQSSREAGLEVSFLGHPCFASRAPAVMAARYGCTLFVPICYRVALGRWVIEMGEPIPTHADGRRRLADAITRDINAAMEVAVRRDPANWFWVHNRWKTRVNSVASPMAV